MTTSPDLSASASQSGEPTAASGEPGAASGGPTAASGEPTAADARRIRRPRDMALSLGVLLLPILLIILIGRFFYGDTTTATVDPQLALQGAARASMQPIPAGTAPADWKIVSARFDSGVLRIGYLDPKDKGAQLVQGTAAGLVARELGADARPTGDFSAGGRTWSGWAARDGLSALTRTEGATTIILVGAVGTDGLATLAEAVTK